MHTNKRWGMAVRICHNRILILPLVLVSLLFPQSVAADIPTGYQDYYVLGYEEHSFRAFTEIEGNESLESCVCSVVSMVATADQQVVYYDHWEDGYETDVRNPVQISTEVHILTAGTILSLESSNDSSSSPVVNRCVPSDPRSAADIRYDGRDRIFTSGGPVALTHAMWLHENTWVGAAWEVYPSQAYEGTYSYYIPIGEDLYPFGGGADGTYGDFRDVFLQLAAFEKNTTVSIDNNVDPAVNFVLDQGDAYDSQGFINSRAASGLTIYAGTTIRTNKPIQVGLMTGADKAGGSGFQGRFYNLLPERQWGADYTVIVPRTTATLDDPAEIYITNPNDYPITIHAYDSEESPVFDIASNQYLTATVPYSTKRSALEYAPPNASVRLTSPDGPFGVLVTADTSETNYDWGFTPVPNQYLDRDYYVSWAPGSDDWTENGSPVWVAPVSDNTTFFVDYGPADGTVDRTFTLNALEQDTLYDPGLDNDNTGMHVWATSEFAIAWGEDPAVANAGDPCLDLGFTVLPAFNGWLEPAAELEKSADPVVLSPDGGMVTFTLVTHAYDVPLTNVNISDTLPGPEWTYVPNSTYVGGIAGPNPTQAGQTLLWNLGADIPAQQDLTLTFQASIADTTGVTTCVNHAQALTEDAVHGDALNPTDDATVYISALQLTKSVDRTSVGLGETLVYTLSYHNDSDDSLSEVVIQDVVPVHQVTFGDASAGGSYASSSSIVKWLIPILDPQESGYVTFTVRVNDFLADGTRIENTASGSSDSTPLINSNTVQSVVMSPQMTFSNDGPLIANLGDLITYTFSYENTGGMDAEGVIVTNTIPNLTTYVPSSMEIMIGTTWVPLTDAADGDIGTWGGSDLVVTPGLVAPGGSGVIRYVVQVNLSTPPGSNILNAAVLDHALDKPRSSNMVVTHITPLTIQKSAVPAVAAPGNLITYTLTYENLSASLEQNDVTILDPIPANTALVGTASGAGTTIRYSWDNGATWNTSPQVTPTTHIRWVDANLPAGNSGTLSFRVQVLPTLPDSTAIQNTAYISSTELMEYGAVFFESNPVDTQTVNLRVSKTATPSAANAGEAVAYSLAYGNYGTVDAASVQIFDEIPAGATYTGGSISGTGANGSNPPYLTWTLGTLAAGQTGLAGYAVTLDPDAPTGPLTNTATIRNALMSQGSVATVTVSTQADLQITKSSTPNPVSAGAVLTYTLQFTNTGISDARGVIITDVLPSGVTFGGMVSMPPSMQGPTQTAQTLNWSASDWPVGSPGTLVFTVIVSPDAGGTLVNQVTIASSSTDPVPADNADSETTTVYTNADLAIRKSAVPGTVLPGDPLTYTLVFTNNGPYVMPNTLISDILPAEVTVDAVTSGGAIISLVQTTPIYVWEVADFAVGAPAWIRLETSVQTGLTTGYSFTNTAMIDATQDVQPANNTDQVVTMVGNAPPLAAGDTISVAEGGTATTLVSGSSSVLDNDTDPNDDALTVSLVTDVIYGALTLNGDGTFSYTHDGTENFSDSFVYQLCDTGSPPLCSTATVTIDISPVNDPPVAVGDSATVNQGSTVTVLDSGATSVRDNDWDIETPVADLTVSPVTDVVYGTLTLNGDGTFSYTNNGTASPNDSFAYQVCDTGTPVACTMATVSITVNILNYPPVAVGDAMTVAEGGTVTVLDGGATSVRDNDYDAETPNASLVISQVSDVAFGTLALNVDGTFSYTHDGTENFSDSFVYRVCDDGTPRQCPTATVSITITPVNDLPVISAFSPVTIYVNSNSGPLAFTISDAETSADALTLAAESSNPALIPESRIVFEGNGSTRTLTLTPVTDMLGTATISLTVSDGEAMSSTFFDVAVTKRPPVYLSLVVATKPRPDLVVSNLIATPNDVMVEIKNIGTAPVPKQTFWVDVYIDPWTAPTQVNEVWQIVGSQGIGWAVWDTALPLNPGESLTLRINDSFMYPEYYSVTWPLPEGVAVYAQVDSASTGSDYGAILESHEFCGGPYNNIAGTQVTAAYVQQNTRLDTSTHSNLAHAAQSGLPPRPPLHPRDESSSSNTTPASTVLGPVVESFAISEVKTLSETLTPSTPVSTPVRVPESDTAQPESSKKTAR